MASNKGDFSEILRDPTRLQKFILPAVLLVGAGLIALGASLPARNDSDGEASADQTLPAEWLKRYFGTADENNLKVQGPDGDPDGDGLTNWQEFYFSTDPTKLSTMGDGISDGAKVAFNINPLTGEQIYSTAYAEEITRKFIEDNQLEEFKIENIEKQVNELLNPQDINDVEIVLPDPKTLKVVNNHSPEFIDAYLQKTQEVGGDMVTSEQVLSEQLAVQNGVDATVTLTQIHETIDQLRQIEVPRDFLRTHQMIIAGLFAAAHIIDLNKNFDPQQPLENQKTILQEQNYQATVIQKIELESSAEAARLQEKYPEITAKYTKILEIPN